MSLASAVPHRLPMCAILIGALLACSATAQTVLPAVPGADGTLLAVSAQAEARRAPDIATVSAGVVTQAPDANPAMQDNAQRMAKVVAALRAAGVAERDVQTAGVNLHPQYRHVENQPPVVSGYQATNTVNATIRDIGRLGRILDALVATGANEISGPAFDVDRKDDAYDEARRGALDKARQRAEMYAKALGTRVRRIVSIDETNGHGMPRPMPALRAKGMAGDVAGTSISPGENVLGITLDVVFELGN